MNRRAIPAEAKEVSWTPADGHRLRRIDWTGAQISPRGSILFLPGRGDHYEKYLETLNAWQRAGWRVTSIDWRGQGGSGRLGADAVTGHIDDFAIWIDDLAAFWSAWVAETPAPHVIIGHSMGGHLSLRALAEQRVAPVAAVLTAPMLGFGGLPLPMSLLHMVSRVFASLGDAARPAWKWSEKPGEVLASRQMLLTHDDDRYADEMWWREHRPELVMGPGSWGWVERAYASMRLLARRGVLERVKLPILILATSADRLVSTPAVEQAALRLPDAELVRFGSESRHEILREADAVRDRAMEAIADFLDRVAVPR